MCLKFIISSNISIAFIRWSPLYHRGTHPEETNNALISPRTLADLLHRRVVHPPAAERCVMWAFLCLHGEKLARIRGTRCAHSSSRTFLCYIYDNNWDDDSSFASYMQQQQRLWLFALWPRSPAVPQSTTDELPRQKVINATCSRPPTGPTEPNQSTKEMQQQRPGECLIRPWNRSLFSGPITS